MVPHLRHTELMVVVMAVGGFYAGIGQTQKEGKRYDSAVMCCGGLQHVMSLLLTFAGLDALKPTVSYVSVCSSSTVLVPSTARSATTDSAGFREDAALWTCNLTKNR